MHNTTCSILKFSTITQSTPLFYYKCIFQCLDLSHDPTWRVKFRHLRSSNKHFFLLTRRHNSPRGSDRFRVYGQSRRVAVFVASRALISLRHGRKQGYMASAKIEPAPSRLQVLCAATLLGKVHILVGWPIATKVWILWRIWICSISTQSLGCIGFSGYVRYFCANVLVHAPTIISIRSFPVEPLKPVRSQYFGTEVPEHTRHNPNQTQTCVDSWSNRTRIHIP